jgi:ribulose-5-phosphate 4-epimerase/fuculose-1-phosphate aldolase
MALKAVAADAKRSKRESVSEAEWRTRVELAAAYRLVAHYDMDLLAFNHLSARVADQPDHILLNPFGLLYDQIRASNLVKVDLHGHYAEETDWTINPAAIALHGGVHEAREDINCVMHFHTTAGVTVSMHPDGLLPLAIDGIQFLHAVAYHDYEGVTIVDDERGSVTRDLGDKFVLFMRNHGTAVCGRSIANAFMTAFIIEKACQIQVTALSQNVKPRMVSDNLVGKSAGQFEQVMSTGFPQLQFESLMRMLDAKDPSYRD